MKSLLGIETCQKPSLQNGYGSSKIMKSLLGIETRDKSTLMVFPYGSKIMKSLLGIETFPPQLMQLEVLFQNHEIPTRD